MNYIKESEEVLKNHGKLNKALKNLEKRQEKLLYKTQPKEIGATDYSRPAIQHTDYSEDAVNQICELADINKQIQETEEEMKLVKNILEDIKLQDMLLYDFLKIKYIEKPKLGMREVAEELGYSPESNKTIYSIKHKAIKEFAIRYFGARAIKNT